MARRADRTTNAGCRNILRNSVQSSTEIRRENQALDCGLRLLNSARRQGLQEVARVLPNISTQTVFAKMQGVLTRSGLMSTGRDSDRAPG